MTSRTRRRALPRGSRPWAWAWDTCGEWSLRTDEGHGKPDDMLTTLIMSVVLFALLVFGVYVLVFVVFLPLLGRLTRRHTAERAHRLFPGVQTTVTNRAGFNVIELKVHDATVEVWEGINYYSAGRSTDRTTQIFLEHPHDADLIIHRQQRPVSGLFKVWAWLNRPFGYTTDLEVGVPEIDDSLFIKARKGKRRDSVAPLLQRDEFLEFLHLLTAEGGLFTVYLVPRTVRKRQRVFESDVYHGIGYRPGILILLVTSMEDLGPTRIDTYAQAAARLRSVLH